MSTHINRSDGLAFMSPSPEVTIIGYRLVVHGPVSLRLGKYPSAVSAGIDLSIDDARAVAAALIAMADELSPAPPSAQAQDAPQGADGGVSSAALPVPVPLPAGAGGALYLGDVQ